MMNELVMTIPAVLLLAGLPWKIDVFEETVTSGKITKPLKICVLADLHCRRFGKKQSRIIKIVEAHQPDIIVIPGDLFDYGRDYGISFELLEQIRKYPVFFSSGNHEMFLEEDMVNLRRRMQEMGVHVLEHRSEVSGEIEIIGLSDMRRDGVMPAEDFEKIAGTDRFRLVICHRPHYLDFYNAIHCDLIISGHMHGGQMCIPFTRIGIYGPRIGFFPGYTHGVHQLEGKKMFVSRGLASGHPKVPRLFNNPEIGFITLMPEGEDHETAA